MSTKSLVALLGLICIVVGESIVSFGLNKAEGQMYAFSTGNWVYELDNVAVTQNNKHHLNVTNTPTITSTYIKKINGVKSVYQTLSDPDLGTQIARFDLPFGNKAVLNAASLTTPSGYGYSGVPMVYDDKELIAIDITNGNLLALIDLTNNNITDEIFIFHGVRLSATAVTYNHKTHTAVVFWYTFLYGSRTYWMHVNEYEVVDKKFVGVNTTFPNDSKGDFNNSRANYAAFDSSNNHYWILDDQGNRLIKFSSADLATYTIIHLGSVTFNENGIPAVAYNFGSQLAYVVSDSAHGFYVQEVDLSSGAIRRAKTFNTAGLYAATVELDASEGNLYVGLIADPADAGKISVVDLGNFHQQIITLTH